MKTKIITIISLLFFALSSFAKTYNIKDFGATGDGETLDTPAIQKAIDTCSKNGGGTIIIPEGEYVIATLILKSNIKLSFAYNAHLLGSTKLEDYRTDITKAREGQVHCLIFAENETNITIEGLGEINGRGTPEHFKRDKSKRDTRPRLMRLENCTNLNFFGMTYRNPAFWGLHLIDCKDIVFNKVTIRFRYNNFNNDGFDLDGCQNILVESCDINSGDDGICLKSSLNPCKNITIRNTKISSGTSPIKFGASSAGGFINVDISNCYFYNAPMGAIKLELVDGGTMENINISRVKMENVGCPLFIRLGNRAMNFVRDRNDYQNKSVDKPVGTIRNITVSDLEAEVTSFNCSRSQYHKDGWLDYKTIDIKEPLSSHEKSWGGPIMITGIPNHYVENVTLNNVKMSFLGGGTKKDRDIVVPEDEKKYPEQFFFGVLPAWGAYIRHAKNITFNNVVLERRNADAREMIILDDVEGFNQN